MRGVASPMIPRPDDLRPALAFFSSLLALEPLPRKTRHPAGTGLFGRGKRRVFIEYLPIRLGKQEGLR